jgi:hypothetical protein
MDTDKFEGESRQREVVYCAVSKGFAQKNRRDHKLAFEMALEELPVATVPIFTILLLSTNQSSRFKTPKRRHTKFNVQDIQLFLYLLYLRPWLRLFLIEMLEIVLRLQHGAMWKLGARFGRNRYDGSFAHKFHQLEHSRVVELVTVVL